MCRLDFLIAVVLVPCYMISSAEIQNSSDESAQQGHFENYDSQNSDELFDPMKQVYKTYEDFITSGGKHNTITELLRASTTPFKREPDEDTTVEPEPEATTLRPEEVTVLAPNSAKDVISAIDEPSPQPLVDISNASELSSIKAKMILLQPGEQQEHLSQLHAENNDEDLAYLAAYAQNDTDEVQTHGNIVDKDSGDKGGEVLTTPSSFMETTTDAIYMGPVVGVTTVTQTISLAPATTPTIITTSMPLQTTPSTMATTHIGKKPKTRFFKYSADEILRKYLEDIHIRSPLAALIDTSPAALRKSKMLWKTTLRPNSPIDIILLAFNSSGVGVTYSFKNTRTMIAGIESIQESRDMRNGGSGFYGIMRASELIPYDSAIFITTDSVPDDTNLARYAAITLLKKRIRLYLVWFGQSLPEENETSGQYVAGGVLGEVALRSGGEIIRVTEESLGPNGDLGLITQFVRNDIQGAQVLNIPVDTTVSSVQIKVQGSVEQVTLATPSGELWNLLDEKTTLAFSNGSISVLDFQNDGTLELKVLLQINDDQERGIYNLDVIPIYNNDLTPSLYSVIVKIDDRNLVDYERVRRHVPIEKQHLDFTAIGRMSDRQLAGNETYNQVEWPEDDYNDREPLEDSNDVENRAGRNVLQAVTRIDLGTQTQLQVNPGTTVQMYYEITNLREEPSYHNFQVTDEQRYLRALNPQVMWLGPGQTGTAVVTVAIPPNTEIGTKDKITFTSHGVGSTSQAAQLTVTSAAAPALDRTPPLIYWSFGSRCFGRSNAGRCSGSVWSLEMTVIDYDSGILRLQSNPRGIAIRNAYTAGTTGEIKATYTASCCSPRVTITAFDAAGNQKTISVDVTDIYLDEATIAAITLGVILLIVLLVLLICLIVWCVKKRRKESRELPVYRTRTERRREAAT